MNCIVCEEEKEFGREHYERCFGCQVIFEKQQKSNINWKKFYKEKNKRRETEISLAAMKGNQ